MARERLAADLVHDSLGRLRLRAAELRGDAEKCARVQQDLAPLAGVHAVEVRAATGSIVLSYDAPRKAFLTAVEKIIDVRHSAPRATPSRPIARVVKAFQEADGKLLESSEGRLKLADAAFVTLCVGAAIQVARGYVASPATGLLWSAFALATRAQSRGGVAE
jgi:hypothetical protein